MQYIFHKYWFVVTRTICYMSSQVNLHTLTKHLLLNTTTFNIYSVIIGTKLNGHYSLCYLLILFIDGIFTPFLFWLVNVFSFICNFVIAEKWVCTSVVF